MGQIHCRSLREPELATYRDLWQNVPEYREHSPGSRLLGPLMGLSMLMPGNSVVDVGCGTGQAGAKLADLGMRVAFVDGTLDALDPEVKEAHGRNAVEACLWDDWPSQVIDKIYPPSPQRGASVPQRLDVAICCDVLEHIPEAFTALVIDRCLQSANYAYLSVANLEDVFGAMVGRQLHVTVKPFVWWRDLLGELGDVLDARDLIGRSLFYVGHKGAREIVR